MKNKLTLALISVLVIIGIVVTITMVVSSQKSTYYGYMKNSNTAEKVVSEKDGLVTHNVKLKRIAISNLRKAILLNSFQKMTARHFTKCKS